VSDDGESIGESKVAAKKAITQVVVSRVVMAAPGMSEFVCARMCVYYICFSALTPFIMEALERKPFYRVRFVILVFYLQISFLNYCVSLQANARYLAAPIQIAIIGVVLTFATPLCCALFPQMRYVCLIKDSFKFVLFSSISVSMLEPHIQEKLQKRKDAGEHVPTVLYYNKGL
jgi:hypothetical protein